MVIATGPYTPDTANATATGSTSSGWIEQGGGVGWDVWATRYNLQCAMQQEGMFACYQRDSIRRLRDASLPAPVSQIRILTAGDSITWGYGSADDQGYRAWLADLIDQQRVTPVMSMVATPGWPLSSLQSNIGAALTANTPDIVLVIIGTNDRDFNTAFTATTYGQLIDTILGSSPTVKVVCALVVISQQDSGLTGYEQQANAAIQAAVNARLSGGRVKLLDLTQSASAQWMRDNLSYAIPPAGRWTFDGVHPTDAGYLTMARMWFNALQPWVPGLTAI